MENPADHALASWAAPLPFAVAYSGAADEFEAHCTATCLALGVPLHVGRIDARHAPGESPEDAARRARYVTLASLALAHDLAHVVLAQHADDQVETMLIALSRGAGVNGLAGMPMRMRRHGVEFHRPLLAVHADAVREWVVADRVPHIEDPSNADLRYTRNRIRRQVLPVLAAALPQYRETFARSARNAARASALLSDAAARDLLDAGTPPSLAALRALPRERLANALRHWLKRDHAAVPSEAQLEQLLDQIAACSTRGHRIQLKIASGRIEREGDTLRWYNSSPLP